MYSIEIKFEENNIVNLKVDSIDELIDILSQLKEYLEINVRRDGSEEKSR